MQGKIAVVTGAAGTLGRAVRDRLRAAGASVIGLDVKGSGDIVGVDLGDAAAVAKTVKDLLARHSRIDCLLNVAGGFTMAPATELDPWSAMWKINLLTCLHTTRVVLPAMLAQKSGAIVNVGARGAIVTAGAQMGAYAASKMAVIRLTEALAAETRATGVRVNCVLPSIIDTAPNRQAMPQADPREWVAPEALAEVMVFLCSDAARAIHGAAIPVYGRVA